MSCGSVACGGGNNFVLKSPALQIPREFHQRRRSSSVTRSTQTFSDEVQRRAGNFLTVPPPSPAVEVPRPPGENLHFESSKSHLNRLKSGGKERQVKLGESPDKEEDEEDDVTSVELSSQHKCNKDDEDEDETDCSFKS